MKCRRQFIRSLERRETFWLAAQTSGLVFSVFHGCVCAQSDPGVQFGDVLQGAVHPRGAGPLPLFLQRQQLRQCGGGARGGGGVRHRTGGWRQTGRERVASLNQEQTTASVYSRRHVCGSTRHFYCEEETSSVCESAWWMSLYLRNDRSQHVSQSKEEKNTKCKCSRRAELQQLFVGHRLKCKTSSSVRERAAETMRSDCVYSNNFMDDNTSA